MSRTLKQPPLSAEDIVGVRLQHLTPHGDRRGQLIEFFRTEWRTGFDPIQWNWLWSEAGVVRGVHVHLRHVDFVAVTQGRAAVGLRDLRPGSPSEGRTMMIELGGIAPQALTIPPGVAHGFYFLEPTSLIQGASEYWDPADEIACSWADPALEIPWPATSARLSERDASAPPLSSILTLVPPFDPARPR